MVSKAFTPFCTSTLVWFAVAVTVGFLCLFIRLFLRGEHAEIRSKNQKTENCWKMFPKASSMTLQTPMYIAVSLHPHFLPSSYPTPLRKPRPWNFSERSEHFIFGLRAIFAMQLLKNFLLDFVIWRLILKIKVSAKICCGVFFVLHFILFFGPLNIMLF